MVGTDDVNEISYSGHIIDPNWEYITLGKEWNQSYFSNEFWGFMRLLKYKEALLMGYGVFFLGVVWRLMGDAQLYALDEVGEGNQSPSDIEHGI